MPLQLQSHAVIERRGRTGYPSDVRNEEWAFIAPYLTLCREDAPQRTYPLREVFNAARWMVKTGTQWRYMPHHFPPWAAVYQQTQRWIKAGVFEAMVHDLRALLRLGEGAPEPSAVVIDGRTLQSTPESGARASYDGHKRTNGSKLHMVVDTLGQLLTLTVTPAGEQERAQAGELLTDVQAVTHGEVEVAYVDQGYTRDDPAMAAAEQGITLEVVKLPEAKRGFVLLPRRWVADAASHGRPAFADSPGTTNACPRPSPGSTTSLSPACCSAARPIPSQVHNSY